MPSSFTTASGPLSVLLTDVAVVLRKTLVDDGALGHSTTWEEIAEAPCLLDRTATVPSEQVQSGALKAVERWQAAMPLGTDVLPADRVRVNGVTFECVETNSGQTTAGVLSVDLSRVR